MDRNSDGVVSGSADYVVALRKESVDRNFYYAAKEADWVRSLSVRRAWIEIDVKADSATQWTASLSVRRAWIEICRNRFCPTCQWRSLSVRRAWIEMLLHPLKKNRPSVALRKESVDRNACCIIKL